MIVDRVGKLDRRISTSHLEISNLRFPPPLELDPASSGFCSSISTEDIITTSYRLCYNCDFAMAWPGERRPTLSDAQQAYEQANIPEFASFKECVLAEAIPGGKQGAKDLSMLQNLLNAKRQDGEVRVCVA